MRRMPRTYICRNESDTEAAGREIARTLAPDAVVHLVGDLGAGKTFLARAIAAELGANAIEVASRHSPSFTSTRSPAARRSSTSTATASQRIVASGWRSESPSCCKARA